jgi:hypothetical protein
MLTLVRVTTMTLTLRRVRLSAKRVRLLPTPAVP